VHDIHQEDLIGATDEAVIQAASKEGRALVTSGSGWSLRR
jgi:hypothetical protein